MNGSMMKLIINKLGDLVCECLVNSNKSRYRIFLVKLMSGKLCKGISAMMKCEDSLSCLQ
jgi:hypothetical protein